VKLRTILKPQILLRKLGRYCTVGLAEHEFSRLQAWRHKKRSVWGTFLGVVKSKVACKRRPVSLGMRQHLTETSLCRVLPALCWVSVPGGRGEERNTDAHAHCQTLCLHP